MDEGGYNITAGELHDRIVVALGQKMAHLGLGYPWFLKNHHERPLEQTIGMCISAAFYRRTLEDGEVGNEASPGQEDRPPVANQAGTELDRENPKYGPGRLVLQASTGQEIGMDVVDDNLAKKIATRLKKLADALEKGDLSKYRKTTLIRCPKCGHMLHAVIERRTNTNP